VKLCLLLLGQTLQLFLKLLLLFDLFALLFPKGAGLVRVLI
jgi:hypothetical protein